MTTGGIIAIVAIFLVVDFIIVGAVLTLAAGPVKKLAARFPPVPPAPDAVGRRFQSFRIGIMNLGFCIHAAADEKHMHLSPARLARIFGVRPMSIPWSAVRLTGKRSTGALEAKVEGTSVYGPEWLMSLAGQPGQGD
ncbi:MAG: hypothetical protein JNJ48_07075 [Phycisphaerae bacterium]|nr:hypothetical protein [Phycisphaerae bacterium]